MDEAQYHATPKVVRELFAIICVHCQPSKPRHLWDKHLAAIIEDNLQKDDLQISTEIAAQIAVQEILAIL